MTWPPLTGRPFSSVRCRGRRGGANVPGMTKTVLAARYMADLIRDFELEDFQAAGIVGNGGTESGGFEKLQEISPTAGRGGLGHFQWTGPRRVAFEQWIARNASKGYGPGVYEANY